MVKRPHIRLLSTCILAAALLTAVTAWAGEPDSSQGPVPITTTAKDMTLPGTSLPSVAQILSTCLGVVLRNLPLP